MTHPVEALVKALEPFAKYAKVSDTHATVNWGNHVPDNKVVAQVASELTDPAVLYVGDFRRANEALSAYRAAEELKSSTPSVPESSLEEAAYAAREVYMRRDANNEWKNIVPNVEGWKEIVEVVRSRLGWERVNADYFDWILQECGCGNTERAAVQLCEFIEGKRNL